MSETLVRHQVIELIDALPNEVLPDLLQFAEFLRFKTRPHDRTVAEERALLEIIQRRLEPEHQRRLDELREKNSSGQITDSARAELLMLVEQIENNDAVRAQALIDLARLRNLPVALVLNEFAPEHPGDAV